MVRDPNNKPLFCRVDASPEIGIGHFMRCLSLSQHWADEGGAVMFVGCWPDVLGAILTHEGISQTRIDVPYPDPADLAVTLDAIPPAVPVVLDGYHFDASYHRAVATNDRRVLVVDDNGHLPEYGGDMLLNQTSSAERITYDHAPESRLIGSRYAMLGRAFREHAQGSRSIPHKIARVLVTLGGADAQNVSLEVPEVLAESPLRDCRTRVIAGPVTPNIENLQELVRRHSNVELIDRQPDMPAEMAKADLAIAAAGTTCWELCYMGLPAILTSTADNQQTIAADLHERGAAIYIGPSRPLDRRALLEAIELLASDSSERRRLSSSAQSLVDGRGVEHVAAALGGKFR